jgi:hypothetical protein
VTHLCHCQRERRSDARVRRYGNGWLQLVAYDSMLQSDPYSLQYILPCCFQSTQLLRIKLTGSSITFSLTPHPVFMKLLLKEQKAYEKHYTVFGCGVSDTVILESVTSPLLLDPPTSRQSHPNRLKHETAHDSLNLGGCVIAIDGFDVSTHNPFKSEVIRPKINGFKKRTWYHCTGRL